ncbi:MAG TPA: hypothetical protein VKE51_21325 [Vicinamibacterales bacterium]|nr:hypothetical protein [Vicinamibacterales bacterium]
MRRSHVTAAAVGIALAWLGIVRDHRVAAQQRADMRNMRLVGFDDLQARSAYQPLIRKHGDRWLAYVGHHGGTQLNPLTGNQEINGTSILDVTDPRRPKYLAHIPGEPGQGEAGGAQMVRVCEGRELPHADAGKVYLLRTFGNSAHEIWDVTEPTRPSRVTVVVSGLRQTHKNWWECDTGIAYLISGDPAWRTTRMTKIYDLSDPAHPVFIRDFGLPGQQPGSTGPVPTELHGPISLGPKANRVYFGYGTSVRGIVQIVDREKLLNGPKEPTDENLIYPQITRVDLPPDVGAHTTFPLLGMDVAEFGMQKAPIGRGAAAPPAAAGAHDHEVSVPANRTQARRDFIAVVGETTANECFENRQMLRLLDATVETRPFGASSFTVPESSHDYCSAGGRFGTHSSNENFTPIYYKRVLFLAHFNAGVRAVDIRDPFNPKEIGFYVPAVTSKTDKRCVGSGAEEKCKVAIQTNNVEVDDRGFIYIVDRANTGMHILELTGAARSAARF